MKAYWLSTCRLLLRYYVSIRCSIRSGTIRASRSSHRACRNRKGQLRSNQNDARGTEQNAGRVANLCAVLGQVSSADRTDVRTITSGLVEEARIGIGQKVLDISGGSGEPSLTISRIVGPTGSVTYTDPVHGMLESAQTEAARRGLTNIHFEQCSANDLPFEACTFDVAVGRLSAMFFLDPAAAVRDALRVVLKDGCLAFAVWGPKKA